MESSMLAIMRSAVPVIIVGIILWSIALVVSIVVSALAKVIITCMVGITLGLIGIRYTRRRADREGS